MISKETFCTAFSLIKQQAAINTEFSLALEKVGDGHFIFGTDNKYLEALLMVLKEAINDKYDYIDWWLYEATPDYKVWSNDEKKEWTLDTPEALYDFIINETQILTAYPVNIKCPGREWRYEKLAKETVRDNTALPELQPATLMQSGDLCIILN